MIIIIINKIIWKKLFAALFPPPTGHVLEQVSEPIELSSTLRWVVPFHLGSQLAHLLREFVHLKESERTINWNGLPWQSAQRHRETLLTFLAPVNFQNVKHSPPTPTIAKRLPIARARAASLVPPSSSATSPIWAFSKTLGSCFLADMTVLLKPATIDTPAIPVRKAAAGTCSGQNIKIVCRLYLPLSTLTLYIERLAVLACARLRRDFTDFTHRRQGVADLKIELHYRVFCWRFYSNCHFVVVGSAVILFLFLLLVAAEFQNTNIIISFVFSSLFEKELRSLDCPPVSV